MQLIVFGAVCSLLVLCCAGAEPSPWGDKQGTSEGKTEWICHMNQAFGEGGGGWIDKNKCQASCNSNATRDSKEYLGYIGALVAVLCFGSNFVPVKQYETGDGVFFQWVLCVGIWLVGLVVNFILDSPVFFLPTVIGGFLWTTGNMLVVPIIKMVGMTMGLTVWGVTNMLSGWVVGRFILDQPVSCSGLNYAGVVTVVLSVIILAFVKTEVTPRKQENATISDRSPLLTKSPSSLEGSLQNRMLQNSNSNSVNTNKAVFNSPVANRVAEAGDVSWVDKLKVWQKRTLGFGLSLIAGLVFSFLFLPVQFLKLCQDPLHSCSDLDYLPGVYSGILFTSTFYLFAYSAISGNKPKVYPKVILPGILSGLLWGIAMAGWFLANQHLSMAISFPIVTAGPGFVSSAWGILVYREIRGWRNLIPFIVAFFVSLAGLVMNGLSRCAINC